MLKLGIIGTGWISTSFVEAAHMTKKYQIEAVYSRSLESAITFSEDYEDVSLFNNMEEFLAHDLDVIYIASPNSYHFEHAKAALTAGKNVIVEKPAFSNPTELAEIIQLSKEKNTFFFEAARNIHEPAFHTIKAFLADKTIVGADFTYSKYSSKMAAYLDGKLPNKFNKDFSGGLLADLGVYLIYASIYWFGKPKSTRYDAQILESGVDIQGIGSLDYENYKVAIKCGGNINSYLPCEIYTTQGTLILDAANAITSARYVLHDGNIQEISIIPVKHNLYDEAEYFVNILTENNQSNYAELLNYSQMVADTTYAMRQDAGIVYPADNK